METHERYYRTADGSLTIWSGSNPDTFELPEGAEEITAEQHQATIDQRNADRAARIEAIEAANLARQQEAVESLRELGLPAQTIRFLTGVPDLDHEDL
ncbi:hypothetical protein [Microtetraspora malaysiensis]|uniref:Uncharacterized protein n=1 Tax=Microtetraspora malaysiensis TaxID=161358 RepID=A0ABW6SKJ7_9ACTN